MSGQLSHTPSQVIRQLLIDLLLGADGGTSWPVYATHEPNAPDNCITVYDTVGRNQGRFQVGGEIQETHGIQVKVRATDAQTASAKASEIKTSLSENVHLTSVTVTDDEGFGTATQDYVLYNISFSSGPIPIPNPDNDRKVFTLNLLANLREN